VLSDGGKWGQNLEAEAHPDEVSVSGEGAENTRLLRDLSEKVT